MLCSEPNDLGQVMGFQLLTKGEKLLFLSSPKRRMVIKLFVSYSRHKMGRKMEER